MPLTHPTDNQISEVHPELKQIAARIPRFTFSRRNLWFLRLLEKMPRFSKIPADIQVENIHIPTQNGLAAIRLRIYRPKTMNAPVPGLVWFHGGGYIIGKPEQNDPCCFQYVRQAGIVVVSVDYRTAPKHPFPTPLEDGYEALKWVSAHAGSLGLDADRIAIGGESAGGGLAAALTQLAHDRQEVNPIFQILVYPMLDDRSTISPEFANRSFSIWNLNSNRFGWESYLQQECGAEEVPPYSVPSRRQDLTGLPPAWIGVGSLDLFHAENTAYAQRLKECGVPCELVVVPGAFHGFELLAPKSTIGQDFRNSQISALRKYLFRDI